MYEHTDIAGKNDTLMKGLTRGIKSIRQTQCSAIKRLKCRQHEGESKEEYKERQEAVDVLCNAVKALQCSLDRKMEIVCEMNGFCVEDSKDTESETICCCCCCCCRKHFCSKFRY